MTTVYHAMLDKLSEVFDALDGGAVARAVDAIAGAGRIALYGVGREGLAIKGFAMRLYHLDRKVSVVGDMTATALGPGDLLIVSAGPGHFSTVAALIATASEAGATTLVVTATPDGVCPRAADMVLPVPVVITQDNTSPDTAALPMGGSLYEGALYVLFEGMIVALRDKLGLTIETMTRNHTNLE